MKKIETRVNEAFTSATPNNFDKVAQDCQRTPQKVSVRRPRNIFWKVSTCALAFVLVLAVILGGVSFNTQYASAASITLDVNPSIELKINGKQRIVSAVAQNEDGKIILQDMEDDLKGCSLKVAVNAIIGSMFRNGYLSELTNSVLVSVDSDKSLYEQLVNTVANEIEISLKGNSIDASVVSQWLTNDDAITALVKQYGISRGKAQLIHKISAQTDESGNALYTVDQLVALSVNELGIILGNLNVDDITQSGSSSDKAYIGSDKALEIALAKLGMEGLNAESTGLKIYKNKVDFDDGVMVYEIEFVYGSYEYEVEIGAMSGDVLSFECEVYEYKPNEGAVVLTQEEIVSVALKNANVSADSVEANVEQCRYYRIAVYTVSFETSDFYFEYDIDAYGNILYSACLKLQTSESDNYLTRKEVSEFFLQNNQEGFIELDKLERYRVVTTMNDEGFVIYELSFVSKGNLYVYKIDAANRSISKPEITEYTDVIDNIIKDSITNWDDFEDSLDGWTSWDDWFKPGFDMPPFDGSIGGFVKPEKPDKGYVTEAQVKEIVCKYLSLAMDKVEWLEIDIDEHQGMACYEIELKFDNTDYELKINAYTGTILKCEVDNK